MLYFYFSIFFNNSSSTCNWVTCLYYDVFIPVSDINHLYRCNTKFVQQMSTFCTKTLSYFSTIWLIMKFSREQCSSIDHYLTLKIYDYALSSAPFYPVYLTATNPVFLCPSSRIYRVLSTPLFVSNHNTGSGHISLQQAVYLPLFSSPSLPLAALHTAWSKWFAAWLVHPPEQSCNDGLWKENEMHLILTIIWSSCPFFQLNVRNDKADKRSNLNMSP